MAEKKKAGRPVEEIPTKIEGDFLDVFKVVRENKEQMRNEKSVLYRKYIQLYDRVEDYMKENTETKQIMDVASVEFNENDNPSRIDVTFIVDTIPVIKILKSKFDEYCADYGFVMNYVNLSGNI